MSEQDSEQVQKGKEEETKPEAEQTEEDQKEE